MITRIAATPTHLARLSLYCLGALAMAVATAVAAQDLPQLRAGLWEVSRTVKAPNGGDTPQTLISRECTSPNEDMRKRQQTLESIGCNFSPVDHNGNTYTFSAVCGAQGLSNSVSVLTVEEDAYSIRIESLVDGKSSQELLRARRIGDCPQPTP